MYGVCNVFVPSLPRRAAHVWYCLVAPSHCCARHSDSGCVLDNIEPTLNSPDPKHLGSLDRKRPPSILSSCARRQQAGQKRNQTLIRSAGRRSACRVQHRQLVPTRPQAVLEEKQVALSSRTSLRDLLRFLRAHMSLVQPRAKTPREPSTEDSSSPCAGEKDKVSAQRRPWTIAWTRRRGGLDKSKEDLTWWSRARNNARRRDDWVTTACV